MKKQDIKKLQRMIALTLSLVGGLYSIAWAAPAATALPTGEQDMKNATVTRDTTTSPTNPVMTIEQTKGQNRAFISWDTFNIGKDATVNVKQYSGADLLVNAVRGNNMSEIAGKLNATGNVALINPNGVIFMDGAQVNVGGLGVYATGYDASKGIINSGNEGSIEIQSGAVINVGVSAALANLSALNIAPSDYAIAIDSSGEDGYTNRIHLVAEGNVEIEGGSTIKARDYTYVGDSASVGAEGFNVGVGAVGMGGKIYIRSDRDADDYGSVIITHGENSSKPVMQSVNGVSIYTNAAQVDGDNDTSNGINAAQSRAEKGTDGTPTYYTKHNYKNTPTFDINGSAYTDGTSVSVEGPGTTADKLSSSSADNKITTSYGGNGATTITTSLLVNNIDQLQDIEDGTYGNLDGRYVLGRDINATDDVHSYIDDGILYKMTDGTLTKWSTKDGVAITGTKSGGDIKKTVNGTTIGYSKDENKATTTLTGGTILSNSNGTVGAENTQWSTTKGVSTVTDKTPGTGSTYIIQSDKKSVVDKDGRTSNTAAKTVTGKTDKDNTYTADIDGHTVTHTSDNIVTNTNTHTVTKSAGTSDAGYTATITNGTDTAVGTGTIAIKDITYQVTNGTVSHTVTYKGSSVTTGTNGTNTVTTNGVSTQVSQDGTGTDKVKKGTIASDTVTINGTTTTVNDGTTSYQITTGTDAVTYTKGTTSASISGTNVTTGKVWADTSAGKVVKGDTTAVITSDTAGTVTYSGQEYTYTVSDDTVSMTDSKTGETVTVTGEDATKVLNIFSAAKTALSNAQSIYSDAAKAKSLTKTLGAAIKTLQAVKDNVTEDTAVQSTFQSAAAQLQSDTALFSAASTALTNATTALTQYNALQKAISTNTTLEPALKQAYDEFQSERLNDTTINNIHSDKWDEGKGFNPLGSSDAPFTGTLDGFSGETVFGLYNLTINRPDEDNVGLISVAGSSGNAAALNDIHLYSAAITGKDKVGTVAGTLQQGSSLSWSDSAGTVSGTGESLGGLVGLVDGSSVWDSSSSVTVADGNKAGGIANKAGGIAGTLQNGGTLTDVRNFGAISGAKDVGGIAGYVEGGTITGSGSAIYNYANTYNTGTVTGTTNTGGIVGHAKGIYMYGVFNTNEDTPLSKKSQLIIDDSNQVIQRGDDTTEDKGKTITDPLLKSDYGKVTGVTNTGGLVGYLEDAPDDYSKTVKNINISSETKTNADGTTTKDAVETTIHNNVIDTSYNAGNITGTGDNTGGLVGKMTGGTLSNVYNADNNTVLRQDVTLPEAITSFSKKGSDGKTYAYSTATATDCANQTMTQYYSFFTVDNGTRTYYYFIPVSTASGTTQKGAGGIYVTADGQPAASLPSTSKRYYFNRTFNKDASVTGTGVNTGGLVGSMTTTAGTTAAKYSAGSVIDSAYNAGTITGSDTTTGALVGYKDDASLLNDSFYVTGTDAANGNTYSNVNQNVNQAVGASSAQDKNIENTAGLDATGSKKKYRVSDDSKRGNFPGVQQKTDTDKDSSGNITATYYEYTGTKGSFYTDGTGSIESISHIYPITTTGTTDPSTGKTTYTSTRSTTASYTKQPNGTFKDTSGNKDTDGTIYKATYDTATRQIVLTPTSGSSSNTVILNAVLAARTANETWTIYEDQTRPLLTAFLNTALLSRTFNYNGTTHNLKTDDVPNLYGRADFDGDAGKDVQLSNYQLSSNGVSSEYTYDNTSIWSPQHGYFMDPESTLVINPVNMSANIYGTRVYGDIFNTRGYYVCVPYKEGSDQKYSFYQPAEDGSDSYTLLEGDALQKLFGTETPSEKSLLEIAEQKGRYVLELNGFINGEGVNDLGSLIKGLVQTLSKSGSTSGSTSGTTRGNDLQHLFSNVTADTYLDAGIYNVTDAQITGLTATNQNYTINYGGTLTVKQAELYYTYDGSRTYGLQNTDPSATHVYTLAGVDASAGKDEKAESTHGYLKSWDLTGQTITIKNADGKETKIENPYQYFFTKSKDGTYQINQKYIGVTGYTAKDETKSASLDDIYSHIQGTVAADSINKPVADSTTTFKVIGSYGDGEVSKDMYTHVLVDKDGNPIGYKVTSFASTNKGAKDAGSTIQLYFKTDNAEDSQVKQAAVDKFNQNYKLVWKEGGTENRVYTTGYLNNSQLTTAEDAGIKTTAGGLTINDSTFTILPKTAKVTITGHRAYGDTMDTSSYSTSTGAAASGQDTKANQYNVNIDGLTNGDSVSILDPAKTETLLLGIDKTTGTAADAKAKTVINKYTDVVRDANNQAVYQDISGFTNSNVSVVNGDASTDKMNVTSTTTTDGTTSTTTYDKPVSILTSNNYDYILQDGTHQLKITPVDIHVKVSGSKTYGDFTSQAATDYTASVSGGKTYDGQKTGKVQLKTGEVADIVIANNLAEQSNAGTYTYDSSNSTDPSKAFTISLEDDAANKDQNDYNADNYNISFDTTYTIDQAELWYTYEGTRAYGADNTTTTNTFKLVGVDTADSNSNERVRGFLKSWDAKTYGVGTDQTISLTTVGDDKDALYAMSGMADDAANKKDTTIRSITGGNSDGTYSHVIVDKDGMVIGYNLSSLGLSADNKLSLTDTEKNAAFKNNYTLVWKPQVQTGTDGKGTIQSKQMTTASVKDAATDAVSINRARTVDVGASTLTINPVNLTVEVTGKRQYGHTMTDSYQTSIGKARVTANGVNVSRDKDNPDTFLENGTYNLNLNGLVANDDESVLNTERVKEKLEEVEGDGKDPTKINKYTAVNQGTTDNLATKLTYNNDTVHAFDITKRDDNTENKNSQITVTDTTNGHYNLLNDGNYDYRLVDGTHTLTIDRQDLNLDIKAERQYGDISNQRVVSDYKNNAIASGTTSSYATGITVDGENGLQNGETIDFTGSEVDLSQDFYKADVGEYKHDWYNDDTGNGTAGITNIHLQPGTGSGFDPKNYNIHYRTTYTIDKADLYYTYDGERHYGEDNAAAAHTYTIVGKDNDSSKESVRGYLKSWDSGVLSGGNVLNKDLLTVTNEGSGAYTMTGVAVQDAGTTSADGAEAENVTDDPKTSKFIGKDSGYSHVIVDADGHILSYTLTALGTKIAGKDSTGTLAKNYNLVWKQGGSSHQLDKAYTASNTASTIDGNGALQAATDTANKIAVKNSSFKIDPLALTVTVTGQRDYGDSMAQDYTTGETTETGKYNLTVTGDFANGEKADSVLDADNVKKMLASLENDETKGDGAATRENSNGADGKISRYTDVKRKADDPSQIDSYSLNVGSADTSSTITLASNVQKDASGKVISIKHANQADSSHGFNVLNDNNYDYVVSEGSHTLTIKPVNLTVNVKGESTYGKADTTYTVTSIGAKNRETIVAGSETKSNLAANAAAGSYTANGWTDTTGAATSTAAASGKYLNTAARRAGQSLADGTTTDKGIYTVQLAAGTNTDNSGLSTFSANNYNITYKTTQVVNPAKLTITIDGTKVYGSQSDALTSDAVRITGAAFENDLPSVTPITDNMNQTLMDAGTYHHDWSSYAGIQDKKESYTYVDTEGNSYTAAQDKAFGVTGVDVKETSGFSFNNYDVDFKSTYKVTPRTVRVTIAGKSTYGDAALTAGRDYKTIDFEKAGADGEGLVGGQTISKGQVTVQTDGIDEKTGAGTYHLSKEGGQPGIRRITVKDGNGFKNNNYRIVMDDNSTYTIDKRPLTITIRGEKTYGDPTSFSGRDYTVSQSGLQNDETIDFGDARVLHSQETADPFSEAGQYSSRDGKGILGFDSDTLQGEGFKLGNYALTYDTDFVIHKRPVDVYMESRRTSGSPSSLRMDEPMTMRNVPKEHQSRFLSDMEVIDTSPQIIAAGDYPGFDGRGYLDLYFAGDIYRNYDIHRHTVYHILPDRMVKLSIYNAVQPVRRPILDVMYFKVNGSEGINRWGGTENLPYGGEIILNKDVTSSIPAKPKITGKSDFPQVSGQEFLKEEITQAVPVVYTDGRKQDVRGRYYLAYENDNVAMYPAEDAVSAPLPKEASVSRENRKLMRIPWQGGEGEYHVAYADGIVQIYPENETAYRLVQAKGKDEQLLLERSLTSAVRELGVQLEGIDAIYIYTK